MIKKFYKHLLEKCKYSTQTAYKYYDENYSYPELYGNMKKINYYLQNKQKKKIVLYGPKSFQVYSAIYSILLSGNIWIPLTPGLPEKRLSAILELSEPDVILYDGELDDVTDAYVENNKVEIINLDKIIKGNSEKEFDYYDFKPDDWAYIMFTSGSTGTPKGVPMTHLNYINFVENAMAILPFSKGEVFSDYHDFGFDISIFYLFCAPLTESSISPILKIQERMLPISHAQKNKITVWSSVPSMVSSIQRFRPDEKQENSIKIMFLCGEPFNLDILQYCYTCLNVENVYNFYGLTETGVENFYHTCSKDDSENYKKKGFVPIGKPLKGNKYIISDNKELLIGGCQITPGYLGNIGIDRFETIDGERWYSTGDIVEMYDEVLFCKGRVDAQVKIGGYRVELMDIEVHIKQHNNIKEAVCFVCQKGDIKRLVCGLVTSGNKKIEATNISEWLKNKLPDYMVPKIIFQLSDMPLNNNGKIDRRAVKEKYMRSSIN